MRARDGLQVAVLAIFPLLLTVFQFRALINGHQLAPDFTQGPLVAARRVLAGQTPYVPADSPALAGTVFVYPAVAALMLAPLGLLSQGGASEGFALANLIAIPLALWVLSVRDWRVYGVCLIWPPVMAGWETGNVTLLLALGVALLWRYRDRAVIAGGLLALLISIKVFLWPLALWLLVTKRFRQVGWTLAAGLAINLVAWGVLGFSQLARYAGDLQTLTRAQATRGYSLIALAAQLGFDTAVGYAAMVMIALALAAVCIELSRRGRDRQALAAALVISLVLSPISWLHYFALLVVPLALARPRLSALWLILLLLRFPTVGPTWSEIALMFALALLVIAAPARSVGHSCVSWATAQLRGWRFRLGVET